MKTNISVILPVYKLTDDIKQLFDNAVKSIEQQKVLPDELLIVVGVDDKDSLNYIKKFDFGALAKIVTILENDGETDFCSQMNLGVANAKSDWVSLIEQDDEFASTWLKNVLEYRTAYPKVDLFLPIIVDVDASGVFNGFSNEASWATSFSDELGILDLNALLAYPSFNIDGMVIKKSIYEELGGLKASIKLTFVYEFLLRMAFKDTKIMTIPRFGYKHVNQRPGSLFASYKETIDPVEARFWMSAAKRDYFFDKDRKITYEVNK